MIKNRRMKNISKIIFALIVSGQMVSITPIFAQLTDLTQTPNTENVGIRKSLQEQIGAGRGDAFTPDSSEFIIRRDPFRSIRRGRQLFQRKFTMKQGLGPRTNDGVGDIEADGSHGAGLADSCAACHGRPKGSAGFGGDVFTRPDSRDAPHLFGLGIQEMLADEMTTELRTIRDAAVEEAKGKTHEASKVTFSPILGNFVIFAPTQTDGGTIATGAEFILLDQDGNPIENIVDVYSFSEIAGREAANAVDGNPETIWESNPADGPIFSSNVGLYVELGASVEIGGILYLSRQDGESTGTMSKFIMDIAVDPIDGEDYTRAPARSFVDTEPLNFGGATAPQTHDLIAKGINFGRITVLPDGTVDDSEVEGVNKDLRVRPFFAQGETISIREFVVGALNAEMGLEAPDPDLVAASSGSKVVTPAGMVLDGSVDTIEAPPVSTPSEDSDGDGVRNEINPALVDHFEFYLLNYFKPGTYRQSSATSAGRQRMEQFGCTVCHVPNFTVDHDRRVADVETVFDPENGIINGLFASVRARVEKVDDGSGLPVLQNPLGESFVVENIYTDFKRHDLGPGFWERNFDGTLTKEFMTEPLWGVGSTAPYGHDGRSINLEEVILRHGGEAAASSEAFEDAPSGQQQELIAFLQSLVIFPPDDTASNLNRGDPSDPNFPQRGHGSINLTTQFNDRNDVE